MSSIASRIAPGAEDLPGMIYRYHYLLTQASGNSLFSMMFRAFEPVLTTLITAYYTRPTPTSPPRPPCTASCWTTSAPGTRTPPPTAPSACSA